MQSGVRTHIPVGGFACLMLEPGTRVSHAAVALAARAGTLLIWVGEAGVRLYAAGQPGGARADRLLYQARLALDEEARLKVVRKMYRAPLRRAGARAPLGRPAPRHRGRAGPRDVRAARAAARGEWDRRAYDRADWDAADVAEPLPQRRHVLPLRHHRGGGAGGRLCAGARLPAHRQAAVLRLRHRRPVQVRDRGAGRLPGRRRAPRRVGSTWPTGERRSAATAATCSGGRCC